jgi:hypothetical protein
MWGFHLPACDYLSPLVHYSRSVKAPRVGCASPSLRPLLILRRASLFLQLPANLANLAAPARRSATLSGFEDPPRNDVCPGPEALNPESGEDYRWPQ